MTTRVDSTLLPEIRRLGAFDVDACFNCGNCTAICPLSTSDATFPRRLIRYAQVGMRDELLASKELWTCYSCGQCSETCPRQAEPSEFMAAARRYAIAGYDRTRLARFLYLQPWLGALFAILLAAFLALFMYVNRGPVDETSMKLFEFIPAEFIHDLGIVVIIIVFVAGLAGIVNMMRRVAPASGVRWRSLGNQAGLRSVSRALWSSLAIESLGQRRYREECESNESEGPWYRRPWLLHAATMLGFLGLLAATILDYGFDIVGIKETAEPVPIWYPVRSLGTVAGFVMMYGATMLMIRRWRRSGRTVRQSFASDWLFLVLLWLAGSTGFAVELALYLPEAPWWGYALFLFHVAIAMELVLLAPFTKFAHAVYRPASLFMQSLGRGQSSPGVVGPT